MRACIGILNIFSKQKKNICNVCAHANANMYIHTVTGNSHDLKRKHTTVDYVIFCGIICTYVKLFDKCAYILTGTNYALHCFQSLFFKVCCNC